MSEVFAVHLLELAFLPCCPSNRSDVLWAKVTIGHFDREASAECFDTPPPRLLGMWASDFPSTGAIIGFQFCRKFPSSERVSKNRPVNHTKLAILLSIHRENPIIQVV